MSKTKKTIPHESPLMPVPVPVPDGYAHRVRWINPHLKRYYEIWVERDLFDDLTLRRQWGSTVTRRGNMKTEPLEEKTDIQKMLRSIFKTRKKHGYLICGA